MTGYPDTDAVETDADTRDTGGRDTAVATIDIGPTSLGSSQPSPGALAAVAVAASAVAVAAAVAAAWAPDAIGAVGAALTACWLAVTAAAAGARRRRLAWVGAGVAAVQAAAVGLPALGPVMVVAWVATVLSVPDGRLAGTVRRVVVGILAAGALAWSSALAATDGLTAMADDAAFTGLVAGCLAVTIAVSLAESDRKAVPARWAMAWTAAGAVITLAVGGVAGFGHLLLGVPDSPLVPALAGWGAIPVGLAAGLNPRSARLAGRALVEAVVVAGLAALVCSVYLILMIDPHRAPVGQERRMLVLSLAAAFVTVAVAFPFRTSLARSATRLLRGTRPSPQELLSTFGTQMTQAVPMGELLRQLAELLRTHLGPAGAEVWTGTGGNLTRAVSVPKRPPVSLALAERERTVVAQARAVGNIWLAKQVPDLVGVGVGVGDLVRVAPVSHHGNLLGLLVVRRPAAGRPFTAADDRILVDLARQVGIALHNVSLDTALQASLAQLRARNAELQASRARIVSAADASRRRLERDLHDGAQQHLVGLAVKLGLAAQLAEADPASVVPLFEQLRADVRTATAALRELAHGIYPQLLRDHGLAAALRAAASRSPLDCSVEASVEGRHPAEVEAAVYFCCLEALQNAGKHAGAGARVRVSVEAEGDDLRFAVADDGCGFDTAGTCGHGFVNMRDRVGAIGGDVVVTSAPGAGTTVAGTVPAGGPPLPRPVAVTRPGSARAATPG
jgi:signal transduction histidine kinase